MKKIGIVGLLALVMLVACNSRSRKVESGLSQEDSEARAKRVSKVAYDLHLSVDGKLEDFTGRVESVFQLTDASSPLTIDFKGGRVKSITVNAKALDKIDYNDLFITIPKSALRKDTNEIVIEYSHPYSKTGSGLYRFKDPKDGKVYMYTDFEPYDANKLFPCFDQPDLRATFKITAEAPKDWVVISAMRESETKDLGDRKFWSFPESLAFSTYIYSFHAGDFVSWSDKVAGIDLRLFSRQSLAKYVNYKAWFKITKQGFNFYNNYFDYPYPFGKYDQVIVPDFNSGAMENTGAVTFSERYTPRGQWTYKQRENLANTILHEMAHMWFGNLVTMKWWNDLWLNESFATYMAYLALVEATEFKDAWRSFYARTKQWAYWEDGLVTTHPIVANVPNTEQAFVNFDGITYGKGASSLKQLSYFLGAEKFRNGVRQYFKDFAFQNTVMSDFIGALATSSGKDLTLWTDQWLKTSSHNTLKPKFSCEDGKITEFSLEQSSKPGFSQLRSHRTLVGLYGKQKNKIGSQSETSVEYDGASNAITALLGKSCPELVYPNHKDYDFVKVVLDESSLENAKDKLSAIKSPYVRMMFWQSLWDMVYDAEFSLWDYAELKFKHLKSERDIKIATSVAGKWADEVLYFVPKGNSKASKKFLDDSEVFLWEKLGKAKGGSDFQKLWLDTYTAVAKSNSAMTHLSNLLSGKKKLSGFVIDQDRRWGIVIALNAAGVKNSQELWKIELKRDNTESGQKAALKAQVARPDVMTKRQYFDELMNVDSKLPLGRAKEMMKSMFLVGQEELTEKFAAEFFEKTLALVGKKPDVFLASLGRYMIPATCTEKSNQRIKKVIDKNPNLTPLIKKRLRVALQEDQRCVAIRKKAL